MGETVFESKSCERYGVERSSVLLARLLRNAVFLGLALTVFVAEVGARVMPIQSSVSDAPMFPGIQYSRSDSGVKLVVRNADPATLCRYLQTVHGLNALPIKGASGLLQGEIEAVDLERGVELLLKSNGYRGQWIGKILLIGAELEPDGGQTSFYQNGVHVLQGASGSSVQEEAYPTPDPPFIPMEPSPVIVPETTPDSPPEATQGEVAMESTPVPGNPTQVDPSMPEAVQSTPSGIPMEMLPGSAQGDTVSPVVPVESPSQPENVPGMAPGAPVE